MKGKKNDYRAFLKKSGIKAREGKQVYISLANHSVITEISRHTVPKSTVCWIQSPK